MKRVSSFVAVICIASVALAKAPKQSQPDAGTTAVTLAVLDLAASSDMSDFAATATDALNSELIRTKAFTVVERRRIAQVIREQELGLSGAISEESAAKVGQLLGARLLVVGRLSHIGSIYRLDARAVDSDTAKIVAAHFAEFHDRDNLDLAVKEVALGLAGATPGSKTAAATGKSVDAAPPAITVDSGKLHQATSELVKQLAARFLPVTAKLTNVDEAGHATFRAGSKLVFPSMRFDVFGIDDMTGGRAKKGVMVVRRVDGADAAGPTESESSPIATGDDVVSLPLAADITGPSKAVVDAMTEALSTLPTFSTDDSRDGTPVKVTVEIKGTTIGERHLVVSVIDQQDTAQASYESTVGL